MGKNDSITAFDEIICQRLTPKTTSVKYRADICLRGILCLFTPFIRSGLNDLTASAKAGCIKRSI